MFDKVTLIRIRFYKEDGAWYAYVPGVPKEDNLMVGEAHKFLEDFSEDGRYYDKSPYVDCFITLDSPSVQWKDMMVGEFRLIHHDEFGATYEMNDNCGKYNHIDKQNIWLCNVVHNVLGEHPDYFCLYSLKAR